MSTPSSSSSSLLLFGKIGFLTCLVSRVSYPSASCAAVSSMCAAKFISTCLNRSDKNWKSRLRCGFPFPWCRLALTHAKILEGIQRKFAALCYNLFIFQGRNGYNWANALPRLHLCPLHEKMLPLDALLVINVFWVVG